MKLRSLAVNQFKKFTSPTRLEGIEDGLNVVVGPNELGKSTLLDALRAALFEKYSSRAQPIVALQNDRNQAAPVVELAFELDDGLYRITKRFIKKPYARLSCPDGRSLEGDAAEDTLRDLLDFDEPGKTGAKPETLGMWNVLWVQQGHSFRALDLPESARSSLHSALESEVGTVLGGRRGRALPKAIENQLGELVTSTTNRPRGTYKELIDRVETVRQELDDLRARRHDLTQTLNDFEDAQETLERLSTGDRDQEDQMELDEARQRYSQLAELEARIEAAATELELRKRTLEQAEQAVVVRKQLKSDIGAEEAALEEAGKRLVGVREQEREARSRLDALRTLARPPSTLTEGLPSASRETVTSGLLPGGWGGSRSSETTVPAPAAMRISTRPPETSMAPGGSRPVRVTTGGAPCSEKRSGTGNAPPPQGSQSAPSQTASTNVSEQWSVHRQPAGSSLAVSIAFSRASSRESASTVTVFP